MLHMQGFEHLTLVTQKCCCITRVSVDCSFYLPLYGMKVMGFYEKWWPKLSASSPCISKVRTCFTAFSKSQCKGHIQSTLTKGTCNPLILNLEFWSKYHPCCLLAQKNTIVWKVTRVNTIDVSAVWYFCYGINCSLNIRKKV